MKLKKYIFILLTVLISASLILGGCSSEKSPTTNAPATNAPSTKTAAPTTQVAAPSTSAAAPTTAAPVSPAKVYEFKFTDQYTAQMTTGVMDELLAKIITEKTNGQVKFTFYHSESLGKMADFINMVNSGIVDVVNCSASLYPAQLDFELGPEIPMLGIPSREARQDLTWDLYNKGYFKGLEPYKVLAFIGTPEASIFLKKKVTTAAGLQGLKLRTTSTPISTFIKNLGGTPVTMAGSECYMNLDRGIIDGTITMYEAFAQMKMYEVAKFAIKEPLAYGSMFVLMNKDKWNSLPADLQAKVNDALQAYRPALLEMTADPDSKWPDLMREKGMDVYTLAAEESAKLKAAAAPIKAEWVAAHQAKGLPAQEMMDYIDKFVANYKK